MTKIKQIAMIIEAWEPMWGGGQEVAKQLATQFSKQNIKVDLYIMNFGTNLSNPNFNLIHCGKKRTFSMINRIFWFKDLIKSISKNHNKTKYDLIYAHANLPGIPCKILSKKLKIPVIYQVHGCGLDSMKQMYGNTLKTKIFTFIENYVQTKIKYDLEYSVDKKFISQENINNCKFIPNGVNIENFKIKNFEKTKSKTINFLFVGRLHPQKGLKYLIKAVNLNKNKLNNKINITIVGEGEQKKELLQLIKKYKLEKYFKFTGRKSGKELIKHYLNSDIFILPSLFEGFPLTILEAWAAKLPVLVTNVGENSNIIIENKNGWIVERENIKQLSEKILEISQLSKNELKIIGTNGHNLVKKKYTWEKISKEIITTIKTKII